MLCFGGQSAPPSLKLLMRYLTMMMSWFRGAVRPPFIEATFCAASPESIAVFRGAVRPPFIEACGFRAVFAAALGFGGQSAPPSLKPGSWCWQASHP